MTLFHQAIELNNEGVAALLKGDTLASIRPLTTAIKLMREDQITCKGPADLSGANRFHSTSTAEIPVFDPYHSIVFNHAIRLPCGMVAANLEFSDIEKSTFISAVIYNYALAVHINASSKGDSNAIKKAEKLYSVVLRLLNDRESLQSHTAMIVKLASINNMAQIQITSAGADHASKEQESFREISHLVNKSQDLALFEDPKIQGLLMTFLLLRAPTVASAA